MNKIPIEVLTICLIIAAGFFVSEMLSIRTYHAGLRGPQSVPTEMATVGSAALLAQFNSGTAQLPVTTWRFIPDPLGAEFNSDTILLPKPTAKVWYKDAGAPIETGLEWISPKTPPLHLLDMRNRL
jgi:hypothetical protein